MTAGSRPEIPPLDGVELRFAEPDQTAEALDGADALLVWNFNGTGLDAAWPRAGNLRWIHINSAGVDRIITPQIVDSKVVVTNARGVLNESIAEYVLALILAFAKDLPKTLTLQQAHTWQHRPTQRLRGTRALVIGPGAIGRAIGALLGRLSIAVDAVGRTDRAGDDVFGRVFAPAALPQVVGDYDFVVVAAPLTEATRGMISAEVIAAMSPAACLINVGRGPIVDEAALSSAVQSRAIRGAGLDVFENEPLEAASALWTDANVIVSPHMAGDFFGWEDELLNVFLDNLDRYRHRKPLRNVVDPSLGFVPHDTDEPPTHTDAAQPTPGVS
ncbi:D-2-hydroxyacid dehydrogenase [Cryobacterium sp. TMT1-3]|nr:D-2-hydroxyacid dehydrogenase [Cryobacterium sp. TMT1-3]